MNLIFALLTSALSFAYIPEYSMISLHTAEQHGRGAYQIEQEVSFRHDAEVFTVKETWTIESESSMRVTLEGRGPLKGLVQGTLIYQSGQKMFMPAGAASVRAARLGDDWLEPLFVFRSPKFFRARLAGLNVTPADGVKDRPPLATDGDPKYEPPSFIRLSRVGGDVAWAIGASPASGVHPTLWIEQDQFVVRKFRGADQSIVKADDYNKFENGFWYPMARTYTFDNNNVDVHVLSVRSLGKMRGDDSRFKSSSLKPMRDEVKLPEAEPLKEFYSRFR